MSEDRELAEIQERMLAELQRKKKAEEEAAAVERQLNAIVKLTLSSEALQRLKRIEYVRPELANRVKVLLYQLYVSGRLRRVLSDEEFKKLLSNLTETSRRDFNIRVV